MTTERLPEALETDTRMADRLARKNFDESAYGLGVDNIPAAIMAEVERSKVHGEKFASLHEAYAVILEELDEVWDITRQKRRVRSAVELRKEFIQIGAMAVKALQSIDHFIGGIV